MKKNKIFELFDRYLRNDAVFAPTSLKSSGKEIRLDHLRLFRGLVNDRQNLPRCVAILRSSAAANIGIKARGRNFGSKAKDDQILSRAFYAYIIIYECGTKRFRTLRQEQLKDAGILQCRTFSRKMFASLASFPGRFPIFPSQLVKIFKYFKFFDFFWNFLDFFC